MAPALLGLFPGRIARPNRAALSCGAFLRPILALAAHSFGQGQGAPRARPGNTLEAIRVSLVASRRRDRLKTPVRIGTSPGAVGSIAFQRRCNSTPTFALTGHAETANRLRAGETVRIQRNHSLPIRRPPIRPPTRWIDALRSGGHRSTTNVWRHEDVSCATGLVEPVLSVSVAGDWWARSRSISRPTRVTRWRRGAPGRATSAPNRGATGAESIPRLGPGSSSPSLDPARPASAGDAPASAD